MPVGHLLHDLHLPAHVVSHSRPTLQKLVYLENVSIEEEGLGGGWLTAGLEAP